MTVTSPPRDSQRRPDLDRIDDDRSGARVGRHRRQQGIVEPSITETYWKNCLPRRSDRHRVHGDNARPLAAMSRAFHLIRCAIDHGYAVLAAIREIGRIRFVRDGLDGNLSGARLRR